jgi:hypothetical protein
LAPIKIRSRRKKEENFDYRVFFIIGISLFGTGMALALSIGLAMGIGLIGGGIGLFVIGLSNQDKWK